MKKYTTLGLVALLSFLAGKYLFPPQPKIKEVVKVVEVEKKQEKKDKVVKSTKTKKPDGTVVTQTTVTEQTRTNTDRTSQLNVSKTSSPSAKIGVGLLYIKGTTEFSQPANFGATVTVPVIGNLKAQALGTTDKKIGLGLSLEF